MESLQDFGLLGLFIGSFLAATVVPFSSDLLYVGVLAATKNPLGCFIVGTLGNYLGGITTYWIGWIGKWEWIENTFKVKRETLTKQKRLVDKYGVWLALLSWVPLIGDVFALALGFYKTKPLWSMLLLLAGKAGRFAVYSFIV